MQIDRRMSEPLFPVRRRSASLAALLSFLWPGLGQLYRGRLGSAALYALPPAVALLALATLATAGLERLALRLLSPPVALVAIVVLAGLGLWRIVSIFDARRRTADEMGPRGGRRSLLVAALLAVVVVATHGWAGYYAFSFYRAGEAIHEPLPAPVATAPPVAPATSAPESEPPGHVGETPTAPPPTAPPAGMINVLFVGIDRGTRINTNTDTLLFASIDVEAERIVMISIPRDTAQVPLYTGGTWEGKINSLYHYAASNPSEFPAGGMGTLVRQVEYLLGVPIHYYASVEMAGFWSMVDLVGGIDVDLDHTIRDPVYHLHEDRRGFTMEPGRHHLDGRTALAFVRSRHGPGNSDYARARRQQQVLLAFRDRLRDPAVLFNLPSVLDAASEMVRTDVPLDRVPEFVDMLQGVAGAEVENIVLAPRRYSERIPPEEVGGAFATRLKMEEVAALSVELFGDASRYSREAPPTPRASIGRPSGSPEDDGPDPFEEEDPADFGD